MIKQSAAFNCKILKIAESNGLLWNTPTGLESLHTTTRAANRGCRHRSREKGLSISSLAAAGPTLAAAANGCCGCCSCSGSSSACLRFARSFGDLLGLYLPVYFVAKAHLIRRKWVVSGEKRRRTAALERRSELSACECVWRANRSASACKRIRRSAKPKRKRSKVGSEKCNEKRHRKLQ